MKDFLKVNDKQTFGNDTVITNKHFRACFGIAEGEKTTVAIIPFKVIEDIIEEICNSPEN